MSKLSEKQILLDLINSDKESYGFLLETCSDFLFDKRNEEFYGRIKEIEKNMKKGTFLKTEEDFFLGKIIFSTNIVKELGLNLENFNFLNDNYKKSIDLFVGYNLALPVKISKKYSGLGIEREDLIQEGTIKLITAAKKYDFRKGYKFITYASIWVKQGITEALHNKSKIIRKPTHIVLTINKMNKMKETLSEELGRVPSDEEIALKMCIPIEELKRYKLYSQDIVYYQACPSDEDYTFENLLPSSFNLEESICNESLKDTLQLALKTLPKREAAVINLRYGLQDGQPKTLDGVGEILAITRERVRQIESKALRNLRNPSRSKYLKDYI